MPAISRADVIDPVTGRRERGPDAASYGKEDLGGKALCCPDPGCTAQIEHVRGYERLGGGRQVPDIAAYFRLAKDQRHGAACAYPNPGEAARTLAEGEGTELARFLSASERKYVYLNLGFESSDFVQPRDRRVEFVQAGEHLTARRGPEEAKFTVVSLKDLRRLLQARDPLDAFYDDVRVIAQDYSIPFPEFARVTGRRLVNGARYEARHGFRAVALAEVTPQEPRFHTAKDGSKREVMLCAPFAEAGRSGRMLQVRPVLLPPARAGLEAFGDASRLLVCGQTALDVKKADELKRNKNGERELRVFIRVTSLEHVLVF